MEWAEVHGNFYGSPQAVVDEARATRGIAVFDIDVQGGTAIKRKHPEAVLVFILPPSHGGARAAPARAGDGREDTIRRRMLAARSEMEQGRAGRTTTSS